MSSWPTSWRTYSRPMPREAPTTAYDGIVVQEDREEDEVGERGRSSEMDHCRKETWERACREF